MKLGKTALLEIVSIFQEGILSGKDVSEELRLLDLTSVSQTFDQPPALELSLEYVAAHPRAEDWEDPSDEDAITQGMAANGSADGNPWLEEK
jgi:hypothetical protein